MGSARISRITLPLQVAAICYRWRGTSVEFLLVNTNGGGKWTFPKGAPQPHLSHSQSAEREALEEAGAAGTIEPRHFRLYLHSKGVFWQRSGVQEYVVKAFLMQVRRMQPPAEAMRHPTWFSSQGAHQIVAKGREEKYAAELQAVIDHALERIRAARILLSRHAPAAGRATS